MGFVDDYGLGSFTVEEDVRNLKKLFTSMAEVNYKLGADKIWVGYSEVLFLGFKLQGG